MLKSLQIRNHTTFKCFLLIFLCFLLTSAGYLSWIYHLIELNPKIVLAFHCEVIGYVCQAAGLLLFSLLLRRYPKWQGRSGFVSVLLFYVILLMPTLLGESLALVLWTGYASNLLCGIIAGYYLYYLTKNVPSGEQARAFGIGYGVSCIVLWLISSTGNFLHLKYALILYAFLAIFAAFIYKPYASAQDTTKEELPKAKKEDSVLTNRKPLLFLAFATILLLSLVKNLGFDFPAEDISSGLNLELSRVFYGAGLILSGFVNDKNRKYGAVICLAALIIPFIMLILSGASVPGMILWSLNYFFFGFFSVFRVILFSDMAEKTGLFFLAGFGLLAGRIGDAAGTSIFLLLDGEITVLVIVAATLFILTVFLFFRLFQRVYAPEQNKKKTEQERFEEFATRFSFSQRERDVLKLLLKELSNQEISEQLFVSESTVKFHIHNLLKKTGCKNRIELLSLYYAE